MTCHCPLQVELVCGKKEELSHVDEPNKCEYRAQMATPAVCSETEYESVLQQVKQAEADRAEL